MARVPGLIERYFGPLKIEWLAGQRYEAHQAARQAVVEYIELKYDSYRLHPTLGTQTPRGVKLAATA
jgi:transposase InsO family protein